MIADVLNIALDQKSLESNIPPKSDEFDAILSSEQEQLSTNKEDKTDVLENSKILDKENNISSNNKSLNSDLSNEVNINLEENADAFNSSKLFNESNILNDLLNENNFLNEANSLPNENNLLSEEFTNLNNVTLENTNLNNINLESKNLINIGEVKNTNDLIFSDVPLVTKFKSSDAKEVMNKLVSEFNIDRKVLEKNIDKISFSDFSSDKNVKLGEFFKGIGIKDKHLDKAYKIVNQVLARAELKQNLNNSTHNTEELILLNNYKAPKEVLLTNSKQENNIILKNGLANNLDKTNLSNNNESTNSENGSEQNLAFSQNLAKANYSNIKNIESINENIDMKVLNDTVVSNVKILSDKNGGTMQIDLKTSDLGKINLKVETDSTGKVFINLACNNAQTKKLIESNLTDLKSALSNLSIKTESITVALNDSTNMNFENNKKENLVFNNEKKEQNFKDSSGKKDNQKQEKENS